MGYLTGTILALLSLGFFTFVGLGRERAFYPVVLIWIASYYLLFAVMGGDLGVLAVESLFVGLFLLLALAGFRNSLWLVVAGLAGHGLFDLVHSSLIDNSGVPVWWPRFCGSFDIVAGLFLAILLMRGPLVSSQLANRQPSAD